MEKPILFNTEMVRALMDGRKTQTRRLCKGQGEPNPQGNGYRPPFMPGDRLYVRETFGRAYLDKSFKPYLYKADYPDGVKPVKKMAEGWLPSIHMPRSAARIFLRVKRVRCERLQNITEEDAVKEGFCKGWSLTERSSKAVSARQAFMWLWETTVDKNQPWQSWAGNPWVWVIEFEVIN